MGTDCTDPSSKDALEEASSGAGGKIEREWLGLRELTQYACVSERTLRGWIYSPTDPLPATKVCGKVLVRKSEFDAFLQRHRIRPVKIDIDAIVRDVLSGSSKKR